MKKNPKNYRKTPFLISWWILVDPDVDLWVSMSPGPPGHAPGPPLGAPGGQKSRFFGFSGGGAVCVCVFPFCITAALFPRFGILTDTARCALFGSGE